jgi:alpha-1,2-glucosyltransferase
LVRQNNIIWVNIFPLEHVISEFIINFRIFSITKFSKKIVDTISKYYHIIIIDILFLLFIFWNNFSLVLGDKSSHQMSFHLAQINHLLFFILLFFPMLNFKVFRLFYKEFYTFKNIYNFLICFSLFFILMLGFNKYSLVHEFLLSDNRHYSFYYFKKIYLNTMIRYFMISWSSMIYSLLILDNQDMLKDSYIYSYLICVFLALVPAGLFEFRYLSYCILSLLIILHYHSAKWKDFYYFVFNKYNLMWHLLINMISLYVFIYRPFVNSYWGGIDKSGNLEISRFMW